ncbi:MAG: pyrroline-5-carboxylate reductase [Dehalococcoidia bacterium]
MTTIRAGIGRVGLVGGGFMGEGIVQGLLSRGVSTADQVRVCELAPGRRTYLAERYGVLASARQNDAVADADVIVLAVKPQEFEAMARDLAHELHERQLVLSIMAGVTVATIRDRLQHERIVRAMPNTPASVGEGFTGWTATPSVTDADREAVASLLGALGEAAYFEDEKYLDMVTAVSGSGPAFVTLFVEAFIDAAVHVGLKRDVATEMVLQTVGGSVRWARASGRHPAELRNAVTSPGGTSAAGLLALERSGMRAAMVDAVVAALERSRALGG